MKIALIGATGFAGSKILAEALDRDHKVTGIVRNTEKLKKHPNLTPQKGDANDAGSLSKLLAGHDVVISSVHFSASDYKTLATAVKESGVKRWIVVGGAGSLEVAPGMALITTPEFPEAYKKEAQMGYDFLQALKKETALDWTFISPSAEFVDGDKTESFRLGHDQLLVDEDGRSWISTDDFAVAMINEVEYPQHVKQRFTVGY